MQRQDKTQYDVLQPEEVAGLGASHGIWIALATFVPTFLAIFFGIPYLAGLPIISRSPLDLQGSLRPVVPSLAPGRAFVGAPPQEPAPMMPPEMLTVRAVGQAGEPARLPSTPTREAVGNAAVPATTPEIPPPASRPTRPQVKPKAAEPQRSASAVTKDDAWVRGAAFADRHSAERLAASLERQGYPAKVRREDAPGAPWVVWIGKAPRGMSRSERRK